MKELLLKLLEKLEAIGIENEEISDTVCREAMSEAVFRSFVLPEDDYVLPDDFGLCDDDANLAVKQALADYIVAARAKAPAEGLETFHQRLAAMQDVSVYTEDGATADEFIGGFAPELYGESGEWLGDQD